MSMRLPTLQVALAASLVISSGPVDAQRPPAPQATGGTRCGDVVGLQVLLDRRGFSPGEIDGRLGDNTRRALAAFQAEAKVAPTGRLDCQTWDALNGTGAQPGTTTYVMTAADTTGPFTEDIPDDLVHQAGLPALNYRTPLERLAERYHTAPALLRQLNPGASFEAGTSITVPAVEPFDPDIKPGRPDESRTRIEVHRRDSSLRVLDADGAIVFFAPVTIGSTRDPLPLGEWKVTAVSWMPQFNYNPDLFWDANPGHSKATIKPGPNNPVGVVWIDISKEHYGLHGTPEPSKVGHTASHGCVRLTNWDAAKVAGLARAGMAVTFK
jgi:lipoprotein-anchoring transpeptidase ErfK/SrfK